nr:hypothetical protein [Tanacetum cinerariifolium]
MENSSKKVNDTGGQDVNKEIRAEMKDFEDGIGENDLEINKGVFGNEDNCLNAYVNTEEINEELGDSNLHEPAKKVESYVNMVRKDEIPKKLNFRPTMINDTVVEVVVFVEVLVKKGSERDVNGLKSVVEKGPWMVNDKPLIVHKWNHEIGMQKRCTKRPKALEEEEAIKRKEEEQKNQKKDGKNGFGEQEKWDEDRKKENDNGTRNKGSYESDEDDIVAEVKEMNENVIANEIARKGNNILN